VGVKRPGDQNVVPKRWSGSTICSLLFENKEYPAGSAQTLPFSCANARFNLSKINGAGPTSSPEDKTDKRPFAVR